MKKKFDLERLFVNIRRKRLDPSIEEAFKNRMLSHFSKIVEADAVIATKPTRKRYLVYAVVCCLMICLATSGIFLVEAQVTHAKNVTRIAVKKEIGDTNILNIQIDFFRMESTVDMSVKKVIFSLKTKKIKRVVYPNPVQLSSAEENLAKEILQKGIYEYFVFQDENITEKSDTYKLVSDIIYMWNAEPMREGHSTKSIQWKKKDGTEYKFLFGYYSYDPILRIEGYQYPGTNDKEAYVEIQTEATKGYKAILVVDLGKKEIKGPHVEKINSDLTKKKLK